MKVCRLILWAAGQILVPDPVLRVLDVYLRISVVSESGARATRSRGRTLVKLLTHSIMVIREQEQRVRRLSKTSKMRLTSSWQPNRLLLSSEPYKRITRVERPV